MAAASSVAIAAGAVTIGSGIASILGGGGGGGSEKAELPPELEASALAQYKNFLDQVSKEISDGYQLIPKLEERLSYMNDIARRATPDPAVIGRLNALDEEIAMRFGRETAADVKAGIITDAAKDQTIALQNQLRAELESQGRQVDGQLASEIQQMIRNRIAGGSLENTALDEVGRALLDEVRRSGDPIPDRDPRVEADIKAQEDQLRGRLRQQFGPDYENTTQGKRALRDFFQGATETRFSVQQQLKSAAAAAGVARAQRLATLGQTAGGLVEGRDTGLLRNVEAARGTQDILSARIKRLSDIGLGIRGTIENATLAGEPERQRQLLDIQRAGVAQQSIQNQQAQFAQGIQNQSQILQLSQIPFTMRQQLLQDRGAGLEAIQQLGNLKWSKESKEALKAGAVRGYQGRGSIYGGFYKPNAKGQKLPPGQSPLSVGGQSVNQY